jgi:exosortase/archaeosortase family protein
VINPKFNINIINTLIKTLFSFLSIWIIYNQDFIILIKESLYNDISNYILIIPFILAFIIYRLRYRLIASIYFEEKNEVLIFGFRISHIIGILLCIIALFINVYGSYNFRALEIHIFSLPIFITGIVLINFNYRTLKILLFPILFTLLLIPPPIQTLQQIGLNFSVYNSKIAYFLLNLVNMQVDLMYSYDVPTLSLTTSTGVINFVIDLACSGIYTLTGFIIFSLFTSYISEGRLIKKIILFLIGIPLFSFLNIIRITLTVIIGDLYGLTRASEIFHMFGGWAFVFIGTILLLFISDKFLNIKIFTLINDSCEHSNLSQNDAYCEVCGKVITIPEKKVKIADFFKYFVLIALFLSVQAIEAPIFSLTEGSTQVFNKNPFGQEEINQILPEIPGYNLSFAFRDAEFEALSGQNASLFFRYYNESKSRSIWVGIEIGETKTCLHPWEVCLVEYPDYLGQRDKVISLNLKDVHLIENPPISGRYFSYKDLRSNRTEVVLYWYSKSLYKFNDEYFSMWNKISVIGNTYNISEYREIEQDLFPIAVEVINYWEPIKEWSWITLVMAKNAPIYIAFLFIPIMLILFYEIYLILINNYIILKYIKQLELDDKIIFDIISNNKNNVLTKELIMDKYYEKTKIVIKDEELKIKLFNASDSGIISKRLSNKNNRPYYTWKINYNKYLLNIIDIFNNLITNI